MLARRSSVPVELDILFLDDHSPDGTGKVIDSFAAQDPRVFTIHRKGKLGVGSAHFDGIAWAYDRGYTVLVTMDCDFTHPPAKILDALEEKDAADVVVGSRYMTQGSLSGWNPVRKLLTWTGHALTRTLLGMTYDATGAFRLYRLDRIPRPAFSLVTSKGYSFFFESLYILHSNRLAIKEIPIQIQPVRNARPKTLKMTAGVNGCTSPICFIAWLTAISPALPPRTTIAINIKRRI